MRRALGIVLASAVALAQDAFEDLGSPDNDRLRKAAWAIAEHGSDAVGALPRLLTLLESDDRYRVLCAAHVLAAIGPAAREAVPGIVERLKENPHDSAAPFLMRALGGIGDDRGRPAILAVFEHENNPHLQRAAHALLALGGEEALLDLNSRLPEHQRANIVTYLEWTEPQAPTTQRLIRAALRDESLHVCTAALDHLDRTRPSRKQVLAAVRECLARDVVPWRGRRLPRLMARHLPASELAKYLEDRYPRMRWLAASALLDSEERDVALAALTRSLHDDVREVRVVAVRTVATLRSRDAVPALLEGLANERDRAMRSVYAKAMVGIERSALPEIRQGLIHESPQVRLAVLEVLTTRVPFDPPSVPRMLKLVRSDPPVGVEAARILGRAGEAAVPILSRALLDSRGTLRLHVVHALGPLGVAGARALATVVVDADGRIREPVAKVLSGQWPDVLPVLAQCSLRAGRHRRRSAFLQLLPRCGNEAGPVLAAMMPRHGFPGPELLRAMTRVSHPAIPAGLLGALEKYADKDYFADALALAWGPNSYTPTDWRERRSHRSRLASAREWIRLQMAVAHSGRHALAPLTKLARSGDAARRAFAFQTLVRMGAAAVPALGDLLASKDAAPVRMAAWALGTIGPEAGAVAKKLVRMLDDPRPFVSSQAAWALGEIGADSETARRALRRMLNEWRHPAVAYHALRRLHARGN